MKKLAIISTFILGLAATSCDSYLDINESPNSPKESDLNASILFPAAEMNLAGSYGDFLRTGANFTAEDDPDLPHALLGMKAPEKM